MKRYIIPIYIFVGVALLLTACKDALEPKIDNTYSDDVTWTLPDKAQGVLMNAYFNIPSQYNSYDGNNFLDVVTDNAVTNSFSSPIYQLATTGLNVGNNPVGTWTIAYNQFRNIHLFLENGLTDKVVYNLGRPSVNDSIKTRLRGEAYFLRAWWGFKLLQQYGGKTTDGEALGYPIDSIIAVSKKDITNTDIRRNTYEECLDRILRDCDTARKYLPVNSYIGDNLIIGITNLGRADKRTALCLKSIAALYAASPAYQPNTITRITGMGAFTVVDQVAYEDKWKRAATLAQQALNVLGNYTQLAVADFTNQNSPEEFTWRKYANNQQLEVDNYPPANFGNGKTSPSQNLVDAFPASNGFPITDSRSGFNAAVPYLNRDPRLERTVYRNEQILPFDVVGANDRALATFVGGRDTRSVFPNATRTGYYLRKWLSVADRSTSVTGINSTHHYYAMIRRAEIYLNYIEASNEAYGPTGVGPGSTKSAATVLKELRTAALITSNVYVDEIAAKGKEAFRKLIQNERRIELAFENQRYFDMRRWVLPLNESVKGIEITPTVPGQFTYKEVEVEKRNFNNIRDYYMPLPYDELLKSPNMKNNLGW